MEQKAWTRIYKTRRYKNNLPSVSPNLSAWARERLSQVLIPRSAVYNSEQRYLRGVMLHSPLHPSCITIYDTRMGMQSAITVQLSRQSQHLLLSLRKSTIYNAVNTKKFKSLIQPFIHPIKFIIFFHFSKHFLGKASISCSVYVRQRFQPSRFDRESPDLMSCLPLSRFLPNSPDLS